MISRENSGTLADTSGTHVYVAYQDTTNSGVVIQYTTWSRRAIAISELNRELGEMTPGDRAAVLRSLYWMPSPDCVYYPPEIEWNSNPARDAVWVLHTLRMLRHIMEPLAR